MPIQLGPFTLQTPFFLAPMAGVSERPFREIVLRLGAGLAPTELVSANGLVRSSARTLRYLRHAPAERPFVVQIFGGEPDVMERAASVAAEAGADAIDINMGCPVPKVTRSGGGAALLCDPLRAAEIVRRCRRAAGLPVSAKIRAGWNASQMNYCEVAQRLEEAGVWAIAFHPRTRAEGYSGHADWSRIAMLKRAIPDTPVIGNGDILTPGDAHRMMEQTGCDAAMIGRGALGNPWIFREVTGGSPPSLEERCSLILAHLEEHIAFTGDELAAVRQFRRHLGWYTHGWSGGALFRAGVNRLDEAQNVKEMIPRFFASSHPQRPVCRAEDAGADLRTAYG